MKTLIKKIDSYGILKFELIFGSICFAAIIIGLPVSLFVLAPSLLAEPLVLGVVGIAMLLFALVDYFVLIRPYLLYRKLPSVQAETDGKFLYIHTAKEAKIPLDSLTEATVYVNLPYLLQKEFLREFLLHMFAERYGDVILETSDYGSYKMRFVSNAQESADELIRFIDSAINSTSETL